MTLRTSFLVYIACLALCAVAVLVAGCGQVTVQAAPQEAIEDAGDDATDGGAHQDGDDGRDVEPHGPDSTPAPTCATYSSPPYCSSCRDSRGVCRCGALPCCDQACQS